MERYFISFFVIFCIASFDHQVKAVNECSSNPCMNGATCVDNGNHDYYTCQCTTNWMGANCEVAVEGSNCGMNYYSSTGSISSPNYPDDYPNNTHCLYLIRVHGATEIELRFSGFSGYSSRDFLLIGIGPLASRSSQVRRITGSFTYTRTYTYDTNEIWMEFVTDYKDTRKGWSLRYTADFSGCLCFNGGTCVDEVNKQCSCAGWYGARCEYEINECASTPCLNGGSCNDRNNRYYCSCASGWYGTNCESENIHECLEENPCLNGGICYDNNNGFYCNCQPGYYGDTCAIEHSKCLINHCLNGGTCFVYPYWSPCRCQPGYSGSTCETVINRCSPDPCSNGGTCKMDDIDSYTCDCLPEWTGINCTETDECASSPCQNGGTCYDLVNEYSCFCVPGWQGDACNEDINECSSQPCLNGGTCNNDISLYTCDCSPGWIGNNCEIESSGDDDVTDYIVTLVVLAVIILLMFLAFIFYKFCHLKNTEKGCDTKKSVVQYAGPKETTEISTANKYENQVPVIDSYITLTPQPQDQLYEVPSH